MQRRRLRRRVHPVRGARNGSVAVAAAVARPGRRRPGIRPRGLLGDQQRGAAGRDAGHRRGRPQGPAPHRHTHRPGLHADRRLRSVRGVVGPTAHPAMRGYLLLFAGMALVGAYVALSRPLVATVPIFLLAWMRFAIAAVAMLPWLRPGPTDAALGPELRRT